MATDGILRTNDLDKLLLDASQGETLGQNYEAMKEAFHNAQPLALPSDSPLPATEWEFSEEIRWAESTGRRPVILRAHTAEDLEQLKNQILYGK
jgi:hypothetical protein